MTEQTQRIKHTTRFRRRCVRARARVRRRLMTPTCEEKVAPCEEKLAESAAILMMTGQLPIFHSSPRFKLTAGVFKSMGITEEVTFRDPPLVPQYRGRCTSQRGV